MSRPESTLDLLLLEDSVADAELIEALLVRGGVRCRLKHVSDRTAFQRALGESDLDLALVDFHLPGYDGLSALREVKARQPSLPVIVVSGSIGEEKAVELLREGATDYLLKDNLTRLAPAIERAISESRAARAAEEQMERYRLVYAAMVASAEAAFITGADGAILLCNPALERLTGYKQDQLIGATPRLWKSGEHSSEFYRGMWDTIARGEAWQGEIVNRHSDGHTFVVESSITPIYGPEGRITHFICLQQDVTERRRQSRELAAAHAMLATIVNGITSAVVVLEESGVVAFTSDRARLMLGSSTARESWFQFFHPAARRAAMRHFLRAFRNDSEQTFDSRLIAGDGREVFVRVCLARTIGPEGQPQVVATVEDVTERRLLGLQLNQAGKMATLGEMAAGIAHEINQPLTVIRLAAQMVDEQVREASLDREFVVGRCEKIVAMADRATDIISQLRTFARRSEARLERVVLARPVDAALDMVKARMRLLAVNVLRVEAEGDLLEILGNANQLTQVFVNLMLNALDSLESREPPRELRLTVERRGTARARARGRQRSRHSR